MPARRTNRLKLFQHRGLLVVAITILGADVCAAGTSLEGSPPADPDQVVSVEAPDATKIACVKRHEDAQVIRRERRLLDARATLLMCSREECPAAIRADCVEWLEQIGRSLPSVVVTARARGADVAQVKVFVDGKLVAERLNGAALEVDPGEHRFRVESPRWPSIERTILVSEGVKGRRIDVEFAPPLSPRVIRTPQALDYILGGVALAGLGTFAYFGASAIYDRQELEQRCAPFCGRDDVGSVRMKLIVADTALGIAITSLAVGLYLRAVRPVEPVQTVTASGGGFSLLLDATDHGARLGLGGAF